MDRRQVLGFLFPLLLLVGCLGDPSLTPQKRPVAATVVEKTFVGNAACTPCHPDVAKAHAKSPHATTLSQLTRSGLGPLVPPIGTIPGTAFQLAEHEGKFKVTLPSQSDQSATLALAVGSGKTGMTYVAFANDDRMAEFRLSYFPSKKKWYVTPGQEQLGADSLGKVHPQANARKCMGCHAVTLPEKSSVPEPRYFGVGCESCHGAGSAHVADAQSKLGHMEALGKLPASQLNILCGKCHGTKEDVQAAHLPKEVTNRMQTYGLMESKCYQKSPSTLSCITCHAPHEPASTTPKHYEVACLSCHATQKPCPVNAKTQCIGCHMPLRKALAGSDIPLKMVDHRIQRPQSSF